MENRHIKELVHISKASFLAVMHIAKLYGSVYDQQNGTFYTETIFIALKEKSSFVK